MATEYNVRVSDADRDVTAAQLREHYAQGRLTMDELNQRLERTFAAKTRTDLGAVTRDLPYAAPSGQLPSDRTARSGHGWGGQNWSGAGAGGTGRDGQDWRWGSRDWGSQGRGARSGQPGPVTAAASFIPLMMVLAVGLLVLGAFGFGLGSGPSLVVIILAALGMLRRLLGWGRRRGPLGRSRRSGRPW